MRIQRSFLVVLIVLLLGSMPVYSTAALEKVGETTEQQSDVWIKAKLLTTYTLNQHLNPFEIEVDVKDGVVTLDGKVDSSVEQDLAVEIAKGTSGVKKVVDKLSVEPEASATEKGKSSFSQTVDDATITAKVKSRLLWNRNTEGLDINVDTNNGVVVLSGKVETAVTRDLAVQLAKNTKNVTKVEDKLEVTGKKEPGKVEEAGKKIKREVSDAWITGKVKSVLLSSKEAEGAAISVSTENKVVTLSGTVMSKEQKEKVTSLAGDVVGVIDVKSDLKIGDK